MKTISLFKNKLYFTLLYFNIKNCISVTSFLIFVQNEKRQTFPGKSFQQLSCDPKPDRQLLHQRQLANRLRRRLRDRRNRFPVRTKNPARNEERSGKTFVHVCAGGNYSIGAHHRTSIPCGEFFCRVKL